MESLHPRLGYDRKYLVVALLYGIAWIGIAFLAAASDSRLQFAPLERALLIGSAGSLLYAAIHYLWVTNADSRVARAQFAAQQGSVLAMTISLIALQTHSLSARAIELLKMLALTSTVAAAVLILIQIAQVYFESSEPQPSGRACTSLR